MAVATLAVFVERLLALRRAARASRAFMREAKLALTAWDLDAVVTVGRRHRASPLARLVTALAARYQRGHEGEEHAADAPHHGHATVLPHAPGHGHALLLGGGERGERGLTPAEAARHEAERVREALGLDLRRGFAVVASVGSVAPFIGLLGTVVGIISAFQGISRSGAGGIGAVSGGIAEALVETALGLLVAIPAVLLFNYLTTRVNAVEVALARAAGELCDEMEERDGRQPGRHARAKKAA
ncbi:MAG: MotA/TolQ/ExbB proton channel family protein [Myxococcales bacterium]|nr:MotA/TolQ/ExbB proton channel family protein [Myxococcales bacterium]